MDFVVGFISGAIAGILLGIFVIFCYITAKMGDIANNSPFDR